MPNCGEWHLLRYLDMETDAETYKDDRGERHAIVHHVKWRCPACGYEFTERQMKNAVQGYRAQNPKGPVEWYPFLFQSMLSLLPGPAGMKSCGNGWKPKETRARTGCGQHAVRRKLSTARAFDDETIFVRRRESYGAELPDGVLLLTAASIPRTTDWNMKYVVGEPVKSRGVSARALF